MSYTRLLHFLALCNLCHANWKGVQHDVLLSTILSIGCSECYNTSVGKSVSTSSDDITSCLGPYLFVGAKLVESAIFAVGVHAPATEVHKLTLLNSPHEHNGVYWFFTRGHSFGMSDVADMNQSLSDLDIISTNGMLWRIDQSSNVENNASLRSSHINHPIASDMRKLIYSCPTGLFCSVLAYLR
jgi:hypothetical protein